MAGFTFQPNPGNIPLSVALDAAGVSSTGDGKDSNSRMYSFPHVAWVDLVSMKQNGATDLAITVMLNEMRRQAAHFKPRKCDPGKQRFEALKNANGKAREIFPKRN